MPRKIKSKEFELRKWQEECYEKIFDKYNSGGKDFLAVATPGAGKTKLALAVAHKFLDKGYCKRVVVCTPTTSLKKQWALEAGRFSGIDLDPTYTNSLGVENSDYHGVVLTYSLVGQDKKGLQAQNTFQKETLVILDEPHHMGEELNWGDSAQKAFEGAVFRLLLSGTPFRSDDAEIPFVTYKDRVSVSDYNYSYERAIIDGVCRPVFFKTFEGEMKWKVGDAEFQHDFKSWLEKDQESKRLRTALDPSGEWVRSLLQEANKKLLEIRKTHAEAGAMVVTATVEHARKVAKVLGEIIGSTPPIIVSDESGAQKQIDNFRDNSEPWLVSVKMVSEGVDIPRLRVGAYLTNVKAELYFRQLVGRFVRMLQHLKYQDAHIFMPQDKDFVKLAAEINIERDHALDEVEKTGAYEDAPDKDLFGNDYIPAMEGKFIPLGARLTDEKDIVTTFGITNGMKRSTVKVINDDSPIFEQVEALKKRCGDMAKRFAIQQKKRLNLDRPDWKAAHHIYLQAGGKEMKFESLEELKQRVKFYRNLLKEI